MSQSDDELLLLDEDRIDPRTRDVEAPVDDMIDQATLVDQGDLSSPSGLPEGIHAASQEVNEYDLLEQAIPAQVDDDDYR